MEKYDVAIIGAGIIGSLIARELSRYSLSVVLLEAASDVGTGASSANSAIIHSGHDPIPGTLKAALNRRGNELWEKTARELDIPFKRKGSMVVALNKREFASLKELLIRARKNNIPDVKIINRVACLEKEPFLNPECQAALWTPTAGVIDPFVAVIAAAENSVTNGVNLKLNTKAEKITVSENALYVECNSCDIKSDFVINSSGVNADILLHGAGIREDFKISPRRGEYFVFDPVESHVSNVLFPMPSEKGKGTLVTMTMHGNTMIGPNACLIDDRNDASTSEEGQNEILKNAQRLVPSLNPRDIIASFAGIRATGNMPNHDFLIEESLPGLISVAGIDSPGFASAPAIAEYVIALLEKGGLRLEAKKDWHGKRTAPPVFKKLSERQKNGLIDKNPAFGKIVCRCEEVTEGEVIAAIHGTIPARNYDAVKRCCWLGTGRCQGAFDLPRVLEILHRELGIPLRELSKNGAGSEYIFRKTKDVK